MCEKWNSITEMRRARPESGGGGGGGGGATSALIANRKAEPKNESRPRNHSRTKIPSALRNGLENALVGLCDVWFDEIKPHLVSHGIKVHCSQEARGEAGAPAPAPKPLRAAHSAKLLRLQATLLHSNVGSGATCSHLEPGESAAHCELCRLLSGASVGIERAAAQAAAPAPSPAPAPGIRLFVPDINRGDAIAQKK